MRSPVPARPVSSGDGVGFGPRDIALGLRDLALGLRDLALVQNARRLLV